LGPTCGSDARSESHALAPAPRFLPEGPRRTTAVAVCDSNHSPRFPGSLRRLPPCSICLPGGTAELIDLIIVVLLRSRTKRRG
jgi:hypothetical protein